MANNFEKKSFVPAGFEIVSYDDQETKKWRECTNNVIAAEPISWMKPNEAFSEVEGDGSTGKRKSDLEETEKDFSLMDIYHYSNNIDEIISQREKDGITLDSRKLLKYLKGWTIISRTYPTKNGKNRTDKTYRHPKSKRLLRSAVEIMKFIEEISCIRKASKGSERVSLQGSQDATTKMYLQISQRLEETFGSGVHQTWNNGSNKQSSSSLSKKHEAIRVPETAWSATFKSHDTVDYTPNSQWPSHYLASCSSTSHGLPLSSNMIHVPKSEKISDSFQQVFTNGQESVRTFDVGVHQTWNNGSNKQSSSLSKKHEAISVPETAWGATFKSHDTVDYTPHSQWPSHYLASCSSTPHGLPLSSNMLHVPKSEKISDSFEQVFTNGQESVRTFDVGVHQTWNNGSNKQSSSSFSKKHEAIRVPETAWSATFKSHDTVDYTPHSQWPSHYLASCSSTSHGLPLSSNMIHVPKSEKISDSFEQVFTNGQESARTFDVGVHQTWNNVSNKQSSSLSKKLEAISAPETAWGATFKSHDTVDYTPHSQWPSHYLASCSSTPHGLPLSSNMIHVPKSEKISDSFEQVFTNGQESVRTFDVGVHQTWNNGSNKQSSYSFSKKHEAIRVPETAWGATFKSHDTVDYSPHSHWPSHFSSSSTSHGVPLWSPMMHAPSSEKTSYLSEQVFTNGQESVRSFDVGAPACYNVGASSSSKNIASFNEIQKMVQSQLEAQIESKVATQVAEKISHYEKAQKEMAEKMESMERLLVHGGLSPPFQFQGTPRS